MSISPLQHIPLPSLLLGTLLVATGRLPADEIKLTTGIALRGRVLHADRHQVVLVTEGGQRVRFSRARVATIRLTQPEAARLAENLYAKGQFTAAIDPFSRAIKTLQPGLLRRVLKRHLVECLVAAGREARAAETFLTDLAEDHPPPTLPPLPLLGMELHQPGEVEAAVLRCLRDLPPERIQPAAEALLFWARLEAGEGRRAERSQRALSSSDDPSARSLGEVCRGWLLFRRGRAEEALRRLEAALPRLSPPANLHAEALLARVCCDLGRHRLSAIHALHLAFAHPSPLAPEGLYWAGRSLAALGRTDQARALLRELVETYPASPRAAAARKLLTLYPTTPRGGKETR